MSDDLYSDDRRPVVGGGIRHGRDALIKDLRAVADVGVTNATSDAVATRGRRLAVTRARFSRSHEQPEAFHVDFLQLVAIDADERIAAVAAFDLDDFDDAIAELDARYLAGEAAAYAHTWSVITGAFAALNQRELPATTPDWVNVDHRRGTSIAPGEMPALLDAAWSVTSDLSNFIEAVHRLDNLGAVITHVANETSQEGFHAEWRVTSLLALDGDFINRCEVFDEADLDTALARFDQLCRPAPQLENAASHAVERLQAHFAARDWAAIAEALADDISTEDRRPVVNAGIRHGRRAEIEALRAAANVGTATITSTLVATRGERLVLGKFRFSSKDRRPTAFHAEMLGIAEINTDNRIAIDCRRPERFRRRLRGIRCAIPRWRSSRSR